MPGGVEDTHTLNHPSAKKNGDFKGGLITESLSKHVNYKGQTLSNS